MKTLFTACLLLLTTASFAQDETYDQTLERMFEVSGAYAQYVTGVEQMMELMKPQYPEVSEAFWDEFLQEIMAGAGPELVQMLAPVYQNHLTQDDLRGLIKFYESPVGQKYAGSSSQIMIESMQVGQVWGMQIAERVLQRLESGDYKN